jgi:predicted O-linked N-acetylglucosamine transferase (SPINDLY family)
MTMSIDQALRKARSLSPEEAAALYREMLERFPANKRIQAEFQALSRPRIVNPPREDMDRIVTLYQQGQPKRALDQATDLLARFANSEILHNIAGVIHGALGQHDEAITHYDKAVELAPDYFEAHGNRGTALNDLRRESEALASFDTAIRLNPHFAEAHNNRAIALRRLKRFDEALASAETAIALDPARAEAYNNRGNILRALNRSEEALADFDKAVGLKPGFADAFLNRGNVLDGLKRQEDAIASFDRSIALAPGGAQAHQNRGKVLRDLKRFDEALASYRRALELAPASARIASEVRNLEAHMGLWTEAAQAPVPLGIGDDAFPPFYMLGFEDSPQRQLQCARNWAATGYAPTRPTLFPCPPAGGKIRIGYFSSDYHNHATMYLMARLFELHDRSRFEIHAFSYGPDQRDEMRQRLVAGVDAFHDISEIGEEAAATLARGKGIDIAVDLKGHTRDSRSGIFAYRAAPVQVAYLGYPGTMGVDFIDYIIADAVTVPPEHQAFYSEKIAYLPNCYQPNDDRRAISDRLFSRSQLGLPETGFVFCCFNNTYKITPAEFDIWMRLLGKVDGSVLWLLKDNDWAADNLRLEARARGISPDRLVFAERMPLADHLARHRHADLFLDTFNINAHTTASDALWAGLPVLTKLGSSFAARVAGSLLHALDMPELVTRTADAYEQCALEIATNPAALATVKARLDRNRLTAALFDTERYTRDIEALYERLLSGEQGFGTGTPVVSASLPRLQPVCN